MATDVNYSFASADVCTSPLHVSRNRLSGTPIQSPLSSWSADRKEASFSDVSPMSPLNLRSSAVCGRRDDGTPRRMSPFAALPKTPRGTFGNSTIAVGLLSPRYTTQIQRRYQVYQPVTEFSACPASDRRALTPNGRPFSSYISRGPVTPNAGNRSPILNLFLGRVIHGGSPHQQTLQSPKTSPQQHLQPSVTSCSEHGAPARPLQNLRASQRDDDSFFSSVNDFSFTDEVMTSQSNTSKRKSFGTFPESFSPLSSTFPNMRRHQTVLMQRCKETPQIQSVLDNGMFTKQSPPQKIPQQTVTRPLTAAGRASQTSCLFSPIRQSLPRDNETPAGTARQVDLNSTINREMPIQESLFDSPLRKTKATTGVTGIQSPTRSTIVKRCLTAELTTQSCSRPVTAATTATTTTGGTTPAHSSKDCSRSSTETSNVTGHPVAPVLTIIGMKKNISFVSCQPLMQQFIQRWRNRSQENRNAYSEGGYMSVTPGKKMNSRYVIVQKLGWGEFSTVWLAYDTMHTTLGKPHQAFVAIKIAKCDNVVSISTRYEINLLRYIGMHGVETAPITSLIDYFEVTGQYGSHVCMVMPLHGSNLLSIIDSMKARRCMRTEPEIRLVKEIIVSVLLALHGLDQMDIIHTDIKPENILSSIPDPKIISVIETFCCRNKDRSSMVPHDKVRDAMTAGDRNNLVCLADFGLSVAMKPSNQANSFPGANSSDHPKRLALLSNLLKNKKEFIVNESGKVTNLHGTMIQTREYRAPEILIGLDFNARSDIWSVGCMVYELITGDFLVDPKRRAQNERAMDVEHLAMIMQLIGPVPPEIIELRTSKNPNRPPPRYIHRFFDSNGRFIHTSKYRQYHRRKIDEELLQFLSPNEARSAASFILQSLSCFDPAFRPSAGEMLNHPWLSDVIENMWKS